MALQDSPNNTVIFPGATLAFGGSAWSIVNGQVIVDGVPDQTTNRVIELAVENGKIWQRNTDNLWWSKTKPTDTWQPPAGTTTVPVPASPDGTVITLGTLFDTSGNGWSIVNGKVLVNGVVDTTTDRVIKLAYEKGKVWQENADNLWWSKSVPSDTWAQGADPTATVTARTWLGGGNNDAADPTHWTPNGVPLAGDSLTMVGGVMNITNGNLAGDALTLKSDSSIYQVSINIVNGGVTLLPQNMDILGLQVSGAMTSNFAGGGGVGFNGHIGLASNSSVTMTGKVSFFYGIGIDGEGSHSIINNGDLTLTQASLRGELAGNGIYHLTRYHDGSGSTEVNGSVASGVTFELDGPDFATQLVIDHPERFSGLITVPKLSTTTGRDHVILRDLIATSYRYSDDMLTLFNDDTIVDTIRLHSDFPVYVVQDTAHNIQLGFDGVPNGTLLPVHQDTKPLPNPPFVPPADPPNFLITDVTTKQSGTSAGHDYKGPVAGVSHELIAITTDKLNIMATVPNVFIHSGSNDDGIDISGIGGMNVIDGDQGSNFMTGGSGRDQFFVDDRALTADVWTTVRGFHPGDTAVVWGLTPSDFAIKTGNNVRPESPGLTWAITAPGKPNANLTLTDYSTDALSNKLSVSFGRSADTDGLPGSNFMMIHGN